MSDESDDKAGGPDDDKVGYGKPPKHSQFKPGRSGNPRGRPKKVRSIEAVIKRELDRMVTVTEGGREMRISKGEAIVKQLVNRAIKGDAKASLYLMTHLEKNKEIEPFSSTAFDDAELLKAIGSSAGDQNGEP